MLQTQPLRSLSMVSVGLLDPSLGMHLLPSHALVLIVCFHRPLIGGTFSHPARHFTVFKLMPFFTIYPYVLPCIISGAIALGGAVLGYFCLEEVHLSILLTCTCAHLFLV